MRVPLAAPSRSDWTQVSCPAVAPARGETRLLRCDVLADHLLLTVRRHGCQMLVITDLDGANVREIAPSLIAGSIRVEHAEDYDRGSVIIAEESLIEPPAWYQLDLGYRDATLLKRMEVPGYDPARYRTERRDGPGTGRHADPGHAGPPGRCPPGRQRAVPAVRLRRLRGQPRSGV